MLEGRRSGSDDRMISLGPGLAAIPERLLLAHARGQVLFLAGAGVSRQAGLPDFRGLVLKVYERLDLPVHMVLSSIPSTACSRWSFDPAGLTNPQIAEVRRFIAGDYDVVLGMLERRIDGVSPDRPGSMVRNAVAAELRIKGLTPAPIHRALMRLANRGGAVTIATTNFDLLFEEAAKRPGLAVQSYGLGGLPRPGLRNDFAGILHIHGALDRNPDRQSDLIVTDRDFGEFYLRRRIIPDFIYDAARLFYIVLVGYSANDPPMRYLLNAVAADGMRFSDLKERFTFVGTEMPDEAGLADWRERGITPIPYEAPGSDHSVLRDTLQRWAELTPTPENQKRVNAEIKRIVKTTRDEATNSDRDLFDFFVRRGNSSERAKLAEAVSKLKADLGWLDSILKITMVREGRE